MGRFNLGVFGVTGVGKSTLINAVFGAQLAETGLGRPATQGSRLYRHESSSLGVVDSRGIELGETEDQIVAELRDFVARNRSGNVRDQIHAIWYCVRAGSRRIQPMEEEFIRASARLGIPVLLVITQTPLTPTGDIHPDARELAQILLARRLPVSEDPIHLNAVADDFAGVPQFGLDVLLDRSAAVAPMGVRAALASAQVSYLHQEAHKSDALVELYARTAREVGPTGFPGLWLEMLAKVSTNYGVSERQLREILDETDLVVELRKSLRGNLGNAGRSVTRMAVPVRGLMSVIQGRGARERSQESRQQVMRAIGQGWTATCGHFWSESFPDPPSFDDAAGIGSWFDGEVRSRLLGFEDSLGQIVAESRMAWAQ